MEACQFTIGGAWGHFKRPETNNNPLTHDFITKTALIGLMGAVLGTERNEMREKYPSLSEDLRYGVQLLNPVKKESHSFIVRNADRPGRVYKSGRRLLKPKHFEFLKNPRFRVALALKDERSADFFEAFARALRNQLAHYTPVLGLHNCPADIEFESVGTFTDERRGSFDARCFISGEHKLQGDTEEHPFHIGLDRIPTYQEDFWNPPDRYKKVVYPFSGQALSVTGRFYEYDDGGCWWLI